MLNKINRAGLCQTLTAVQPGLSSREYVEQSSCFIFINGRIKTYNGEIYCSAKSPFPKEVTAAVAAAPLMAILDKMAEDEVDIEIGDAEFLVIGKKRRAGIRMDADILLPINNVEKPAEWRPLHAEFNEAIGLVQSCAGEDQTNSILTCVHIHPKWLEATDDDQLARYTLKTGISKPTLVKRDSVKHVVPLGMTHMSETDTWLHFKNASGLVLSCCRYDEPYPDFTEALQVEGGPIVLPRGLADACEKAEIFSKEDKDCPRVIIDLRPGKLRIKGQGTSGWFSEVKALKYSGPPMSFAIDPKLLAELVTRHTDCVISEDHLKVDGGKFVYVTCLYAPGAVPVVQTAAEGDDAGE